MTKWLIVLLAGVGVLAACGRGASSEAGEKTAATSAGSSTAASENPADSLVALTYDPADGSLWRADSQGLFRWQAGSGWKTVTLPQTASMSGVVVNPDQPQTLYASGLGLGVISSNDGGTNWQAVNTGLANLNVTALALHSFQRKTLYAWLQDDGVYRSEDGGAKWVRLPDRGPQDTNVRGLIHSTLPGSMNTGWLYASTPTGGYLSMDCF